MRKTVIALSTASMLLLSGLAIGESVSANTIDDLKEKRSDIQDKRAKVKKELTKTEAKIADVLFDIEEINEEIDELEIAIDLNKKALKETEENIDKLNQTIAQLEEEIEELEERIEQRTEILKERISAYQKTGGNINFLEVILGSANFTDMISRVTAVMKITNADQELIEEQEADKAKVIEKQTEVEEKLAEEIDLKNEMEAIIEEIEKQNDDLKASKKELKKEEKKLKDMLAELEDEDISLAQLERSVLNEIEEARREEALIALANSQPRNNGSTENSSNDNSNNNNESKASNDNQAVNAAPKGGAVSAALSRVGKNNRYVWGGKNPATGFDCSGFVSWAYGGSIPSNTSSLSGMGRQVSLSEAQPGDLIFFNTYKQNGHVGIYLGNGQWVGSQSSNGVQVVSVNASYWQPRFSQVRRIN